MHHNSISGAILAHTSVVREISVLPRLFSISLTSFTVCCTCLMPFFFFVGSHFMFLDKYLEEILSLSNFLSQKSFNPDRHIISSAFFCDFIFNKGMLFIFTYIIRFFNLDYIFHSYPGQLDLQCLFFLVYRFPFCRSLSSNVSVYARSFFSLVTFL